MSGAGAGAPPNGPPGIWWPFGNFPFGGFPGFPPQPPQEGGGPPGNTMPFQGTSVSMTSTGGPGGSHVAVVNGQVFVNGQPVRDDNQPSHRHHGHHSQHHQQQTGGGMTSCSTFSSSSPDGSQQQYMYVNGRRVYP